MTNYNIDLQVPIIIRAPHQNKRGIQTNAITELVDLFPTLCSITPNNPVCVRTYSAVAQPSYSGENVALGINLAMGWDRFFVTVPATYAWTDVDIIPQTVTATNISPRFGMTGDMGERGMIAVFLGATYLDAELLIQDEIVLETPGERARRPVRTRSPRRTRTGRRRWACRRAGRRPHRARR